MRPMFKPFYIFVGYRYIRSKRKNHFISFISLTSIMGVALGVSVLITVLSVMNGFNREIRAQMLSGTPHITVGKLKGPLLEWRALTDTLGSNAAVVGIAPYILGQGMLSSPTSKRVQGVLVKGIDPEQVNAVYPLVTRMKEGGLEALQAGQYNMMVGRSLAINLGIRLHDKISLIVPEASVTPAGILPRIKRFTVTGIFEMGDLYDGSQTFIHLQDADKLFRMSGGVTGVQVKLKEELEAPSVAAGFHQTLDEDYWVTDWTQEFGSFFKALQIQKTVMLCILLLIITVAIFNLVSSLVMMVTDKRSDIAILRALGASRCTIMGIFITQGSLVGLLGTLSGVLLGLYMAFHITEWADFLQRVLNVELISRDVYLVNFLPSEVHSADVIGVVLVTLLMSLVATLYPAWRAANIAPAEALRYE